MDDGGGLPCELISLWNLQREQNFPASLPPPVCSSSGPTADVILKDSVFMFCMTFSLFFIFLLPFLNQKLLKQEQIVYFSGRISCRAVYLWWRQNKLQCVRSCQWRNASLSATVCLSDLFWSSGTGIRCITLKMCQSGSIRWRLFFKKKKKNF